jgi:hypothetical protein
MNMDSSCKFWGFLEIFFLNWIGFCYVFDYCCCIMKLEESKMSTWKSEATLTVPFFKEIVGWGGKCSLMGLKNL